MVHEAVRILSHASMNSKTEFKGYKIARITVEQTEWEARKSVEDTDQLTKRENELLEQFKSQKKKYNKTCINKFQKDKNGAIGH